MSRSARWRLRRARPESRRRTGPALPRPAPPRLRGGSCTATSKRRAWRVRARAARWCRSARRVRTGEAAETGGPDLPRAQALQSTTRMARIVERSVSLSDAYRMAPGRLTGFSLVIEARVRGSRKSLDERSSHSGMPTEYGHPDREEPVTPGRFKYEPNRLVRHSETLEIGTAPFRCSPNLFPLRPALVAGGGRWPSPRTVPVQTDKIDETSSLSTHPSSSRLEARTKPPEEYSIARFVLCRRARERHHRKHPCSP